MRRNWTRPELILAMNLYCHLPFGKLSTGTKEIVALATALGRTPSSVSMKLNNLASLDPFHQERGVKGLPGASNADRAIWREFHGDWTRLAIESEALREQYGLTPHSDPSPDPSPEPAPDPAHEPTFTGETERTAQVQVRIAQRFFRSTVLASYESKCCISGIDSRPLLVASHIRPWSGHPEHRANPRNGLCLSRLHDAAFDFGLITLDEEHRLVLSRQLSAATTNDLHRTAFLAHAGKTIRLPLRFRPDPEALAFHRNSVFLT